MINDIDISVVIGFKNWGQRRLQLAVQSILQSFGPLNGEVIVSDYGSDDGQVTQDSMEMVGARYIYTETDGSWSRSRALNAGFAHARGKILVSTDADMIFSPRAFEIIGRTLLDDPSLCILLQCRDLPPEWSDKEVADCGYDWPAFESVARLRPRWGMGGMMAVNRETFARIRGLDERMHTYGGEDIDFATRAKRAGQRLLWIEDPDVRMYHMWHQPTRAQVEVSQEAREAIRFNKDIVYHDKSFVRNTSKWTHRLLTAPPLVTVAIATRNRAEYLQESITSVLGQTMQDFEIVIVDDGSTDETKSVVNRFDDPRIRYIYQQQGGVASARNLAAEISRGTYTAVHDDDDLMTPWRLQSQLDVLEAGIHGSFGAFVNFDDVTGQMHLFRSKALNPGTIDETGGAPGHGTWLVETNVIRALRYDESLSSGVDNNLALRMVRSGFKLVHCGEILMMRRLHPGQITVSDEHTQKLAARQTRRVFSFGTTSWGSKKMKEERGADDWTAIRFAESLDELLPYLPDHLISRRLDTPRLVADDLGSDKVRVKLNGQFLGSLLPSNAINYSDMATLTSRDPNIRFSAQLKAENNISRGVFAEEVELIIRKYLTHHALTLGRVQGEHDCPVVVFQMDQETATKRFDFPELHPDRITMLVNGVEKEYAFHLDTSGDTWPRYLTNKYSTAYLVASVDELIFPIIEQDTKTLKREIV